MKKRLLSIILAITVIASLLPTMALTAGAEDVGYTLTYDFAPGGEAADGSNIITKYNEYADTSGIWHFVGNNGFSTIKSDYYSDLTNYPPPARISDSFVYATGAPKTFFAVKIYVPVTGEYDIVYNHTGRNAKGNPAKGSIYMLPGDTVFSSLTYDSLATQTNALLKDEISYGGSNYTPRSLNIATDKSIEKGEYIIVFTADEAIGNSQTIACVFPMELTLTSGSLAAPMYGATAGIDKESIEVGKSANITVSGPMSDGSDITAANITYSSDSDCVTVANGVVTGASVGTANITTSVNGVALNTVTVNVAEAAPDYADYTFTYDFGLVPGSNGTEAPYMTYSDTSAMWQMHTKSRDGLSILKYGKGLRIRTSAGYWAAFKINVPASGKYKTILKHYQLVASSTTKAGYGNVYLLPGNTADIETALETATPINGDTEIAYASSEITEAGTPATVLCEEYNIEKGEYILVFKATQKHPDCYNEAGTYPISFTLQGDATGSAYAGVVTATDNELKVGDTATVAAKIYNTADGSEVTGDVTFASDSTAVFVNGTTVTADAVGTAKISASISADVPVRIIPAKVTVVDTTDNDVIFGKGSNIDSKITIDGTLKRGDTVSLTAEDIEGYNFVGWKRGNAVTGKFIAGAPQKNFEYTVYSNSFITAIYEEANPKLVSGVEFWNKNGELVAEYTTEQFEGLTELPEASLIGHTFIGWQTADGEEFTLETELGNGITRAVAEYEAMSVEGPFEADDVQNEISTASMPFNSPIMVSTTSTTFSCWMRNEKIVSYDKDYTYYVWSSAIIDNSKVDVPEDKKPIVILEEGYDAYMIEFDDADYTIVEAGIIAGNGTPIVGSAPEKHIAQNAGSHGQFAVKLTGDYSNVRGYVIYLDGTDYKIVYSD